MRILRKTILLASVLAWTSSIASDPVPMPWDQDWNMQLREGGCWLSIRHRSYDVGRDDLWLRFIVPAHWRDRATPESRFPVGTLVLFIYTSNANLRNQQEPALRIDSASISGRRFDRYDMPHNDQHDETYRYFNLSVKDSLSVFKAFQELRPGGHLDLDVTLSDGQSFSLKAPAGWFFGTWSKMLAVCMNEGAIH